MNEQPGTDSTHSDGDERERRLREQLIAALQSDAEAYRSFLADVAGFVRGFLRRRMRQWPDEVEDLVQETLLAIHNHRHTYDPAQPVTKWLHAIARYKLIDLARRRARTNALTDSLDDVDELLLETEQEPEGTRRDLHKLLELLPDKQRLPIVYVKLQGMSVLEAARLSGLSESAVKVGVHRGLKALAKLVRRDR